MIHGYKHYLTTRQKKTKKTYEDRFQEKNADVNIF